mmetsp:Transcript_3994/g.11970  ORF Transcript_3994/g.11970 Transcript_3994/m.11970 type:complete len:163 (+) Transcript_3994:110-598(+)
MQAFISTHAGGCIRVRGRSARRSARGRISTGRLVAVCVSEANGDRFSGEPMRTRVPLRQLAVGDVCEGVVTRLERYGFFVDIGTETNGLVHVSEIANGFISNVADYATVGDRVKAKIIDLDTDRRKLSLSVKQVDGANIYYDHIVNRARDWGDVPQGWTRRR